MCDRQKLRTPILGVCAHYLRMLLSTDAATVSVVQMEQRKGRLLPKFFDFVQGLDDMRTTTQTRELFGPLPEILEKRITKHNAQALQPTTAPTSDPGRRQRSMFSEGGVGVDSTESPERLPMDITAPKPLRHEPGQLSNIIADVSSSHVLQTDESEDWVESDLDELTEVFERELQCTPERSPKTVAQDAEEWAVADLDASPRLSNLSSKPQ